MKLRNVRNALCIAAVSAAVALSGAVAGAPAMVVQAEETQMAALDDILRQMNLFYQNGDFASMVTIDASETVNYYAELLRNSGSDRYVINLDGNTKAMFVVTADGGYWWYFGQTENNLRQGTGSTVLLGSSYYEVYTGAYNADFPNGTGTYSIHWFDNGSGYDISGTFQGMQLNGTYQVNAVWLDEGAVYSSSLPITYSNSILSAVGGWSQDVWADSEEYVTHLFYNDTAEDVWFDVDSAYSLAAVGITPDGYSGHWWGKGNVTERFSSVFYGNAAASAYASTAAPETPAPVAPETPAVPETPVAPQPEVVTPAPTVPASGTYVVERGDNLSRIAQKVYGDRKMWRKIYDANKDVIKSDYVIWANQVLVIPAV